MRPSYTPVPYPRKRFEDVFEAARRRSIAFNGGISPGSRPHSRGELFTRSTSSAATVTVTSMRSPS